VRVMRLDMISRLFRVGLPRNPGRLHLSPCAHEVKGQGRGGGALGSAALGLSASR
jgi:hypothetical protein